MHLIITGCEYSGTTTLSLAIGVWGTEIFGGNTFGPNSFHDHWKLPHINNWSPPTSDQSKQIMAKQPDTREGDFTRTGLTDEEQQMVLNLTPKLKEMVQRYHLEYHIQPSFYKQPDHNMVGAYVEEAVYGPLYFGYGGTGQKGDRAKSVRAYEERILDKAPDTVFVLVKATPGVIRKRMENKPHVNGVVKDTDIEHVLMLFDSAYESSLLHQKITIDTSTSTIKESLAEFVDKIKPHLTEVDLQRILDHEQNNKGMQAGS